jgi:hypothetical protein
MNLHKNARLTPKVEACWSNVSGSRAGGWQMQRLPPASPNARRFDARTAPILIPSSPSNAYAASVAPVRRSHASSTCRVRPSAPCRAVSASGGSAHSTSSHRSCAMSATCRAS